MNDFCLNSWILSLTSKVAQNEIPPLVRYSRHFIFSLNGIIVFLIFGNFTASVVSEVSSRSLAPKAIASVSIHFGHCIVDRYAQFHQSLRDNCFVCHVYLFQNSYLCVFLNFLQSGISKSKKRFILALLDRYILYCQNGVLGDLHITHQTALLYPFYRLMTSITISIFWYLKIIIIH